MRDQASLQTKKPALSGTGEHGLRLYSLAAAAASVSALALAQPAEAEVIITNKTIPIHANTPVNIDLNGDGVTDFEFFFSDASVNTLDVFPEVEGNAVIGKNYFASAMLRGAKIGPGGPFIHTYAHYGIGIERSALCTQNCGGKSGYSFDQSLDGNWGNVPPNRFVGVKFKIDGKIHYGWIRMTVTVRHKGTGSGPKGSFSATITEYGYETIANKSLSAGLASTDSGVSEPQTVGNRPGDRSLGMLALGADGLSLWRREEQPAH